MYYILYVILYIILYIYYMYYILYIICIFIYIYIYILKCYYKEIEKSIISIITQGNDGKKKLKNLKSPFISILTC